MNEKSFNHAIAAMVALNEKTFPLFDSYEEYGVKFEMYKEGLIMAFLSGRNLEAGLEHAERFEQFGFDTAEGLLGSRCAGVSSRRSQTASTASSI